jgi:hypothetical protein
MARSSYIYLVTEMEKPVAAFTVKWEMEWWIIHHPGTYKQFRMRDGSNTPQDKLPIEITS